MTPHFLERLSDSGHWSISSSPRPRSGHFDPTSLKGFSLYNRFLIWLNFALWEFHCWVSNWGTLQDLKNYCLKGTSLRWF
ncbi:hypothetical protein V6Z11_D13G267000 [Gossypium hirsutum]